MPFYWFRHGYGSPGELWIDHAFRFRVNVFIAWHHTRGIDRHQVSQRRLQTIQQIVIGGIHICKQCIPAAGWNPPRIQQGDVGRQFGISRIRVPETAEALGLILGLENLGDIRKIVETIGEQIILGWAEAEGKIIVLLWRQMLLAEKNDLVIEEGLV